MTTATEQPDTLVKNPGRLTYDSSVPRLNEIGENKDPPPEYKSIQKSINCMPGGTVDRDKLKLYLEYLHKKGFRQIETSQLWNIKNGTRVAYLTKAGKWRSGGFLVEVRNSNTTVTKDDQVVKSGDGKVKMYFNYKTFNGGVFCVQEEDIEQLWAAIVLRKDDKRVKIDPLGPVTKFAATAKNEKGEDEVIRYLKTQKELDRFLESKRYENIVERGFVFLDKIEKVPRKFVPT